MTTFKEIALIENVEIDLKKLESIGTRFSELSNFKYIVKNVKKFTTKYEGNTSKIKKNFGIIIKQIDDFHYKVVELVSETGTNILNNLLDLLRNLKYTCERYYSEKGRE